MKSIHQHGVLTKRGTELHEEDRRHVLSAYVHRNTVENPHTLEKRTANTKLPEITDRLWLQITDFAVKKDGRLDRRVHECHTHCDEVPEWKRIIDVWANEQHK